MDKPAHQMGPASDVKNLSGKFIGLQKYEEDGLKGYRNVVLTVKEGKVVEAEFLEPSWNEDQSINIATGWIDNEYYGFER